jgi:hypothetical protein
VKDSSVVPHNQIAIILPLDQIAILRLACVSKEFFDNLLGVFVGHAIKMVDVRSDIQGIAAITMGNNNLVL